MAEPIPIKVTRYRCPHCTRSRSRKSAVREHISRCWANPETRTCRTCAAYETWPDTGPCLPGRHCDCGEGGQSCQRGVSLSDDGTPITGCTLWTAEDSRG